MKKRLIVLGVLILILVGSVSASSFKTTFTRMNPYPYVDSDEVTEVSQFDLVVYDRSSANDVSPSLHDAIHAINPNTKVFYYTEPYTTKHSTTDVCTWNNIARFSDDGDDTNGEEDRGHSQGDLFNDNPDYFFKKGSEYCTDAYKVYILNFDNPGFIDYASEALLTDFVGTPCSGDGVFFDNMNTFPVSYSSINYETQVITPNGCGWPYPVHSDELWRSAMNDFSSRLVGDLNAEGQDVIENINGIVKPGGYDAFIARDQTSNPPQFGLFEYSFFDMYHSTYDVQYRSETDWKKHVDIVSDVSHMSIVLGGHSKLDVDECGSDNYGDTTCYWDQVWYHLTSYLIARRPNTDAHPTYVRTGSPSYNGDAVIFYDEYEIDIGEPVSDYQITNIGGRNIYWREYDKGYVYVNPTGNDVSGITLPETCKQLNHDNFKNDPSTITDINSINLISHRGTILLKTESSSTPYCGDGNCDVEEDCGETDVAPECNSDCGICSSVNELISHWNFDETSGTIAHDSTGNNNGTINGATWTQGKINGALDFDGANDNIFADSFSGLADFKGSVSMWIKPESMGEASKAVIFNMDNSATLGRYGKLYFANTNALKWDVWDGTNFLTRTTNNNIITMNNWNHVVYTFTGTGYTSMKIYINGVEVGYVVGSGTGSPTLNIDELILGSFNSGGLDAFNGTIDEVKIYNYVLSEAKVLDLYNEGASDCSSGADTDGNSMVEISELINYISEWKNGSVLIGELINGISEWKSGC